MRRITLFLVAILVVFPATSASGGEDLQAIIDAAEPGAVVVLQPGTYDGNVTIDKPLTLKGEGWPVIDGGGVGNVITVDAPDVTLTGLVIRNTGDSLDQENAGVNGLAPRVTVVNNRLENVLFGVYLRLGDGSYVADNVIGAMGDEVARRGDGIRLWESSGSTVERNVVEGGRDTVLWFSDDLVIRDNRISDGRYGLHFMYSDRAIVSGNELTRNSVGGFLMYSQDLVLTDNVISHNFGPSGYGIGLKDMDGLTATGNHVISNRVGIYLDNSPATPGVEHQIEGNLFAYNGVGIQFLPSVEGNTLSGNAFVDNAEQVGVQGSGVFDGNTWTVGETGNHWSDFAGYDATGDGRGDIAYRLEDLFSSLTDDHPELQFFDQTPASKAVDLAGQLFPAFRPRPKVEDTAPLIEMPEIPRPISIDASGSLLGTGLLALSLLATAVGLLFVARRPGRRLAP